MLIGSDSIETSRTVWRLRAATSLRVECCVTLTNAQQCNLTVTYGSETVLYETYPDEATAEARAAAVRQQLLSTGWKLA